MALSPRALLPTGLLLFLVLAAEPSEALPLKVLLHPRSGPWDAAAAVTVTLTPAQSAAGLAALTSETTLGAGATIDVPPGSVYVATVRAAGYFAAPRIVSVAAAPLEVAIDLLPAGSVFGSVQVPRGQTVPGELTLRLRSAPGTPNPLPEMELPCPVAKERFDCPLPAGDLDLRLHARSFLTQARWGARVPHRRGLDLGVVSLKPGAAIVGWIEAPAKGFRFGECAVEIAPETPVPAPSAADAARRSVLAQIAKPNGSGFFEFSGVAPGSYRVVVKHPRYAPSHFGPVRVYDGLETEIKSIALQPPAEVQVHLDPPLDPYERPWSVGLYKADPVPSHFEPIKSGSATPSGVWKVTDLEPGTYALSVHGSFESQWWSEEIRVLPGMPVVEIALPVVRVAGTVSLGDDPLRAVLWFGGRYGPRRIAARSDVKGRYEVVLPRQKEPWRIEVLNANAGVSGALAEVPIPEDKPAATVDVELPDTKIVGDVVDEDDRPVPMADVDMLKTSAGVPERFATHADDPGGHFELRGLAWGEWRVQAEAPGRSSETQFVQLAKGGQPLRLKLVLRKERTLAGQVIGPSGEGIPGAQVIANLEQEARFLTTRIPLAATDVAGLFSLDLPAEAAGVQLTIFPPGFAVRQVRVLASSSEPLIIPVSQVGGTVTVRYAGDGDVANGAGRTLTSLFHDFELTGPVFLSQWASLNGVEQSDDGRFVIPMLEPGPYVACFDVAALTVRSGRPPTGQGASRCVSGELAPYGELTLSLAAEKKAAGSGSNSSAQ